MAQRPILIKGVMIDIKATIKLQNPKIPMNKLVFTDLNMRELSQDLKLRPARRRDPGTTTSNAHVPNQIMLIIIEKDDDSVKIDDYNMYLAIDYLEMDTTERILKKAERKAVKEFLTIKKEKRQVLEKKMIACASDLIFSGKLAVHSTSYHVWGKYQVYSFDK